MDFLRKYHAVPTTAAGINWKAAETDALIGWARGGQQEAQAECLRRYREICLRRYRELTRGEGNLTAEEAQQAIKLLYAAKDWPYREKARAER